MTNSKTSAITASSDKKAPAYLTMKISPKTKKILRIAGIAAAAFAVIGTTIGLLTPFVFVPSAQISEVKKGNIFSFNEIGDSYSVRANTSLEKYFSEFFRIMCVQKYVLFKLKGDYKV